MAGKLTIERRFVLLYILDFQLSSAQSPGDIPSYWLVNRDPYDGLS